MNNKNSKTNEENENNIKNFDNENDNIIKSKIIIKIFCIR